ncbi:trace amine-associated receptor 13c-like [Lepisosteus oculatus]|uniref:trace amine-associated receptor 13c-like n=1 Tax=Lepisosteus oculatus TaxID=7918 RepID=UPI0003EAAE8F
MDVSMLQELRKENFCYPTINGSCTREVRSLTTYILLYILLSTGMIITIFGNLVVMISITYFKQLHTPTNMLVLSLALADFLLGMSVMPFSMIRSVETCWYYGDMFCQLHSSFDMFLTTVSIFHLIFIALDRYQAVCNPLHYYSKITNRVAWLMIGVSWGVAAIYTYGLLYSRGNAEGLNEYVSSTYCLGSCVLFYNALWGSLDTLIAFFLPCCIMVGLYTKIFFIARKHVVQIGTKTDQEKKDRFSEKSEWKAAKTLGIVVGVFILCWMPFFVNSIIDPFTNFSTPAILFELFVWLGYFNSTLNPIIYAFFYPWFQKSLKLIVTFRIFTKHSSSTKLFSEQI